MHPDHAAVQTVFAAVIHDSEVQVLIGKQLSHRHRHRCMLSRDCIEEIAVTDIEYDGIVHDCPMHDGPI